MTIQQNYPNIRPSMSIDFANTKQLDPRITYSRASTGTYYDGKTVAKAEENLLAYSQEFDNAAWVKGTQVTVTANTSLAPDGTSTADLVVETNANATHQINQVIPIVTGLPYAASVFIKKGSGVTAPDVIQLTFGGNGHGTGQYANFNISVGTGSSGTVTAFAGGTASISAAGNNWWRCTFVASSTATASGAVVIGFVNNDPTAARLPSYIGSTTSDVFIWGAQLEQRSFATAYTPTTTAPITNYIPVLQTASAGTPRFDHNPITGESLGLLIEEQRTNLLLRSEEFDNAAWVKSNTTVNANAVVSPDGTVDADKLIANTTSIEHLCRETLTLTAATHTLSVYAKAGEYSWISLTGVSFANAKASFNLSAGTVGAVSGSGSPVASISNAGNGWFRCVLTFTASASAATYGIAMANGNDSTFFAGDGVSGVYIWGAQLEAGAFATSYIPTSASQVTRAADAASMTGANFSSWYNAAEGTIYSEVAMLDVTTTAANTFYALNGSSANYIHGGRRVGGGGVPAGQFFVFANNATQAWTQNANAFTATNTFYKSAGAYRANDFAQVTSGGTVGTDVDGILPNGISTLVIGSGGTSGYLNGTIKKIAYYPQRLTNTQLQALTT